MRKTLNFLESQIDSQYWQRGKEYYKEGLIKDVTSKGSVIKALCEGNSAYRLEIDVKKVSMRCSCPCGFPCKHLAALIMWLKANKPIDADNIEAQLLKLPKAKLVQVLKSIIEQQPDLHRHLNPMSRSDVQNMIRQLWLQRDSAGLVRQMDHIRKQLWTSNDFDLIKQYLRKLIDMYDHDNESNEVDTEICTLLEEARRKIKCKKECEELKAMVSDYPFEDFL